jgi:hypothetical protein
VVDAYIDSPLVPLAGYEWPTITLEVDTKVCGTMKGLRSLLRQRFHQITDSAFNGGDNTGENGDGFILSVNKRSQN